MGSLILKRIIIILDSDNTWLWQKEASHRIVLKVTLCIWMYVYTLRYTHTNMCINGSTRTFSVQIKLFPSSVGEMKARRRPSSIRHINSWPLTYYLTNYEAIIHQSQGRKKCFDQNKGTCRCFELTVSNNH